MAGNVHVEGLIRQTRRYEYADGLRDLQLAALFVLIGLVSWVIFQPGWIVFLRDLSARQGRLVMWIAAITMLLIPAVAAWGFSALMTRVRRRWLWRESGMVVPSRRMVPRYVNLVGAGIVVVVLGAASLRASGRVDDLFLWRSIWAAAGWATAWVLIGMSRHLGLGRYLVVGIVGGVLSAVVLMWPLPFSQAGLWFGLLWGLVLAGSGIFTLRRAVASHE